MRPPSKQKVARTPEKKAAIAIVVGILFYVCLAVLTKETHKPSASDADLEGPVARQTMWRNFQGLSNDPFLCKPSNQEMTVSFDNGRHWWNDDGRCTGLQPYGRKQQQRDKAAKMSSYWATSIRVDTDMDSSWLKDEERFCQTYPDEKGRVSVVACNERGSHSSHNIPVTFWGGVDRNTVSNWKCRREGDAFVCRAID
jgi:hypothetical protein